MLLVVLFQSETYPPVLLGWKAKKLRQLTGDERYQAAIEIRNVAFTKRLKHALYRPFLLTTTEPIVALLALYLAVIYVMLVTFLNGRTLIFTKTYGFSASITGLSFIEIASGLCLTMLLVPLIHVGQT